MAGINGYVHLSGQYCGSAALSDLATYHDWGFDELTCFRLGGAIASRPGVPYRLMGSVDWETAWDDVQTHIG